MTEHSAPTSDGQAPSGPARDEQPHPTRPPLERSDSHRVVAGVCGGVGRHLDIDPVVFRVVIAVLCLSGGVGLFIYGMAWLIIPVERTGQNELQRLLSGKVDWQSLGAVLVTVLGTGIFFSYMGSTGHIFPLLLIALLAFAALRYDPDAFEARRRQAQPSAAQTPASVAATVLPTDATTEPAPAWWQRPDPLLKKPGGTAPAADTVRGTPVPPVPPATPVPPAAPGPPTAPTMPLWGLPEDQPPEPDRSEPAAPAPPRPPRPAPPRRERSYLGTIFFCLAVITSGAVWLIGERLHHGADLLVVLSSGLLVLGLGLLLGARWGRARSLVLWGALLTLAVAAVAASPVQLRTTYQHVNWAPTATAVPSSYRLSTGAATLDLSSVTPGAGRTVTTRVTLGAGALTVRLPSGPEIHVHVRVGVGALELPGGADTGGVSVTRTVDLDSGGAAAHGTIDLDISVGAGQAEVIQ